jgi:hypothetical protein
VGRQDGEKAIRGKVEDFNNVCLAEYKAWDIHEASFKKLNICHVEEKLGCILRTIMESYKNTTVELIQR